MVLVRIYFVLLHKIGRNEAFNNTFLYLHDGFGCLLCITNIKLINNKINKRLGDQCGYRLNFFSRQVSCHY